MEEYTYLIPANSKKQSLIFGFFNVTDLIIFIVGTIITLILGISINALSISAIVIILFPIVTAAFLVFPIPNYHNVRTLIKEIYLFYFKLRRRYVWRGWCYKYEQRDDE